jgi:hypothetical protein
MSFSAKMSFCVVLVAALVARSGGVYASPVELSESEFASAISGLSTQVEGFQGFTGGGHSSPFTFLNGTYAASSVYIDDGSGCGGVWNDPNRCLGNGFILGLRTFSAPPNATYWGVDMHYYNPARHRGPAGL